MSTSNIRDVRDESLSQQKEENMNVNNLRDKTPPNEAETKKHTGNVVKNDNQKEKNISAKGKEGKKETALINGKGSAGKEKADDVLFVLNLPKAKKRGKMSGRRTSGYLAVSRLKD